MKSPVARKSEIIVKKSEAVCCTLRAETFETFVGRKFPKGKNHKRQDMHFCE